MWGSFLARHSQQHLQRFDIVLVVERKALDHVKSFQDDSHSSLVLYRTLQPEYKYAQYLSEVKCLSCRRLLSRFRNGCRGLRVDTGRWQKIHLDGKDRLCLVCRSTQHVEDEHHFLFDCAVYSSLQAHHASLFQQTCSVSDVFTSCDPNARGGFIRSWFSLRSSTGDLV